MDDIEKFEIYINWNRRTHKVYNPNRVSLLSKEKEETHTVEEELVGKQESFLYKKTLGLFGAFWATVILVEMMDLAFSIDNVIAANAYSKNIILILQY